MLLGNQSKHICDDGKCTYCGTDTENDLRESYTVSIRVRGYKRVPSMEVHRLVRICNECAKDSHIKYYNRTELSGKGITKGSYETTQFWIVKEYNDRMDKRKREKSNTSM